MSIVQLLKSILTMHIKFKQNIFFLLISFALNNGYCQNLSVSEITALCSKSNWETINNHLITKGWAYYESSTSEDYKINTITWSYEKEYYSEKALGWFYVYSFENAPMKISFNFFNLKSYNSILGSIGPAGYKLIDSKIGDNSITLTYLNQNYILTISTSKRNSESDNDVSSTSYEVTVKKKNSYFDYDNGIKKEYFPDGTLKKEYTLTNGKLNGNYRQYHENGNLQLAVKFVNGKREGLQQEFDELGNIEVKINFKENVENGLFQNYQNGRLNEEYYFISGIKSGKYTLFNYDDNSKVIAKLTGRYENDLKQGKWTTSYFQNGTDTIVEYVNYKDDLKHGETLKYIHADTVEISNYEEDYLHGYFKRTIFITMFQGDEFKETGMWVIDCEGNYKNGIKTGLWKYYSLGNLKESGIYDFDRKDGIWTSYLTAGEKTGEIQSQTEFLNNKKNGKSSTFYELDLERDSSKSDISYKIVTTQILEEIYYKNDLEFGSYSKRLNNGQIIESGYYIDGKKEKTWFLRNEDKTSETTNYRNDKKNGEYIIRDSNSRVTVVGSYWNDLKSGLWKFINNDSSYLTVEFQFDNPISNSFYNHDDDLIYKESLKNGKIQKMEFFQNGKLQKSQTIASKINGYVINTTLFSTSNSDTVISFIYTLESSQEFDRDIFDSLAVLNGDFKITVKNLVINEGEFCNNSPCGNWKTYYTEQNVYSSKKYSQGIVIEDYYYNLTTNSKYNGRLTIYNDSERITYKIKDGLKDGKSKIYNSIGTLIDTIDYKNGIKINKK